MRISIDERDITCILELEQYIKERQYFINWQEYELILELAKALNPKDIEYYKTNEKDYFEVAFVYQTTLYEEYCCWTKVGRNRELVPRHRCMKKNIEEVKRLYDLYYYLSERTKLINTREFILITMILSDCSGTATYKSWRPQTINWVNISEESKSKKILLPSGIEVYNQIASHCYLNFEQFGIPLVMDTYVMQYNTRARERRRENV